MPPRFVPPWARLAAGGFDQLVDMFATDTGEAIELTYHLRAFAGFETVFVKCTVALRR